jgi:hypothetical protein
MKTSNVALESGRIVGAEVISDPDADGFVDVEWAGVIVKAKPLTYEEIAERERTNESD